jgi:hypothetical protein
MQAEDATHHAAGPVGEQRHGGREQQRTVPAGPAAGRQTPTGQHLGERARQTPQHPQQRRLYAPAGGHAVAPTSSETRANARLS